MLARTRHLSEESATSVVPKLPARVEEDLSKGILEAIAMDSYRVEKLAVVKIQLPDANA